MNREIQLRLQWAKLYEEHGGGGYVCRRCGISRPTRRKWWRRYQEAGLAGLESQSGRLLSSPAAKVGPHGESFILDLRHSRNLGARRIQSELRRQNDLFWGLPRSTSSLKNIKSSQLESTAIKRASSVTRGQYLGIACRWTPARSERT